MDMLVLKLDADMALAAVEGRCINAEDRPGLDVLSTLGITEPDATDGAFEERC